MLTGAHPLRRLERSVKQLLRHLFISGNIGIRLATRAQLVSDTEVGPPERFLNCVVVVVLVDEAVAMANVPGSSRRSGCDPATSCQCPAPTGCPAPSQMAHSTSSVVKSPSPRLNHTHSGHRRRPHLGREVGDAAPVVMPADRMAKRSERTLDTLRGERSRQAAVTARHSRHESRRTSSDEPLRTKVSTCHRGQGNGGASPVPSSNPGESQKAVCSPLVMTMKTL